ncbi:MAG: hypothetical protein JNK05_35520 [Myxococcales bacterium]|nr:hypothetical protein [Myxococcales bacterium]
MQRSLLPALVLALVPLISWVPDWRRDNWPVQVMAHPCAHIQLTDSMRLECAADGSVAVLTGPVDYWLARRMRATQTFSNRRQPAASTGQRPSLDISVVGDIVVVEHVTCGACRRVMGQSWAFRPAKASAASLASIQAAAGLPARPLLQSVSAWSRARP